VLDKIFIDPSKDGYWCQREWIK